MPSRLHRPVRIAAAALLLALVAIAAGMLAILASYDFLVRFVAGSLRQGEDPRLGLIHRLRGQR